MPSSGTPAPRAPSAATIAARRRRLTDLCLALPEAEVRTGEHDKFTVRGKAFAYYLDDHHGDGVVAVSMRVGVGANEDLIAEAPERFYRAKYMHHHGWVCLRLDGREVDWDEVTELVTDSYRLQAPKRLAAALAR
jgi:hypothetical protein